MSKLYDLLDRLVFKVNALEFSDATLKNADSELDSRVTELEESSGAWVVSIEITEI